MCKCVNHLKWLLLGVQVGGCGFQDPVQLQVLEVVPDNL